MISILRSLEIRPFLNSGNRIRITQSLQYNYGTLNEKTTSNLSDSIWRRKSTGNSYNILAENLKEDFSHELRRRLEGVAH